MSPLKEYDLKTLLSKVTNFNLSPVAQGREKSGLFGKGNHDLGFVQVDDIEFIKG